MRPLASSRLFRPSPLSTKTRHFPHFCHTVFDALIIWCVPSCSIVYLVCEWILNIKYKYISIMGKDLQQIYGSKIYVEHKKRLYSNIDSPQTPLSGRILLETCCIYTCTNGNSRFPHLNRNLGHQMTNPFKKVSRKSQTLEVTVSGLCVVNFVGLCINIYLKNLFMECCFTVNWARYINCCPNNWRIFIRLMIPYNSWMEYDAQIV